MQQPNNMREEIPICKDCGQPMIPVGEVGTWVDYGEEKEVTLVDGENKPYAKHKLWEGGRRPCKLYQCPEDKTIAIL